MDYTRVPTRLLQQSTIKEYIMSKKYIELMQGARNAIVKSDTAEKDFFMEVYGELKSGDDYDTIVSNIKEYADELVVQRQLITVVNMAKDYVGSKLFTRILEMRWYNVKSLVALIRYINKEHGADAIKGIKRRISNVGKDIDANSLNSKMMYNNALDVLIKEIKQEYKVVITDDSKVVTTNVKAVYNGMTLEQKKAMLELLLGDADVTPQGDVA